MFIFISRIYTFQVPENATFNSFVGEVKANDSDGSPNLLIRYRLHASSEDPFSINRTLGIITVNGSLDREEKANYTFIIMAIDEKHNDTATLIILIEDVNDNPPIFSEANYFANITEDAPVGTFVVMVFASDNDTEDNAQITYEFAGGSGGPFIMNQANGTVTIGSLLDRENKSSYDLVVVAEDGKHTANATLYITLTDANDNAPIFSDANYTATLPEDASIGTLVLKVFASDKDIGNNARITYGFAGGISGPFNISKTNGSVTIGRPLDRETNSSYLLTVVASDGINNGTAPLLIRVEDVNDNPPIFSKMNYAANITENAPNDTFVLRVSASDKDLGSNADIFYSFLGGGPFLINATNGNIIVGGPIDREEKSSYNLTVLARDRNFTANATVSITVTDINDNPPVFSEEEYTSNVTEDALVNSFVLRVFASDEDIGSNAQITYAFLGAGGPFNISKADGNITVGSPIDRERNSSYLLEVIAFDGLRNDTSSVLILIGDRNDNPPIFSENIYDANITENTPVNTSVLKVSATDADIGSNAEITYEFEGTSGPFVINGTNGNVMVEGPIDREENRSYSLVVLAKDGEHTGNATLFIRVTDVNDNAPVFSEMNYVAKILENATLNAFVLMVSATDKDTGSNAEITYEFAGGSGGPFNISGTNGSVTLGRALDREENSSYNLVVLANDTKHIGNATLNITVGDVNDNPPVFSMRTYTANITENAPANTFVLRVSASDRDAGINAEIRYTFAGESGVPFFINETNGIIKVGNQSGIDRERESNYFLEIVASDGQWKDTASLNIMVLDVNDNRPDFSNSCTKNHKITTQLAELRINMKASDGDIDRNAFIDYSVKSASELFNITENGTVYTLEPLQQRMAYHLQIIAEDRGDRKLSSSCNITIEVKGSSTTGGLWNSVL